MRVFPVPTDSIKSINNTANFNRENTDRDPRIWGAVALGTILDQNWIYDDNSQLTQGCPNSD